MISAAESLAHVLVAAGISTAMVGRALVGHRPRAGETRRRVRRLWFAAGAFAAAMTCGVALADTDVGRGTDPGRVVATLAAIAVGVLVAGSLVIVGLRGRRVGDHPYCRRCGFDLTGRPDTSRACAECGAPLDDAPRAIVVGERQRRLAPLLAGVFVGVVALAYATSLAPGVVRSLRAADYSSYKPDAWLIDDLYSRDVRTWSRASNELSLRAQSGKLGRAALAGAVTRLLTHATPRRAMPGVDQDATFAAYLAERAWRHGDADEAVVRRAMRACLACTLVVAPQASAGRTLRFWISAADYRIARQDEDDPAAARLTIASRVDALDGVPLPAPTWSTLRGESEWPGLQQFGNAFDLRDHVSLGPATLTTRFTATLTLAMPGRPTLAESADVALAGTTTLVDAATMACPPIVATTRPAAPSLRIIRSDHGRVLAVQAPPDGALFADVVLHHAGAARTLGTIFAEPNGEATVSLESRPPGPYEIELRPVPERGADLFKPVPILNVPTTIPSTAIEDDR